MQLFLFIFFQNIFLSPANENIINLLYSFSYNPVLLFAFVCVIKPANKFRHYLEINLESILGPCLLCFLYAFVFYFLYAILTGNIRTEIHEEIYMYIKAILEQSDQGLYYH